MNIFRLLWILVAIFSLYSVSEATESPEQEKSYNFFVGVNLSIPYEDAYVPIDRIWNARAHIKVDDQLISQKVKDINDLMVDRKVKISQHLVEISDLQCEPIYSVGRDPRTLAARQQVVAQAMASGFSDEADSALRQSANPEMFSQAPDVGLGSIPGEVVIDPNIQVEQSIATAMDYNSAAGYDDISPDTGKPMWDLLHIQFSISSANYFPSGHLVFIFQLADRPEGEPVLSWFHFLSLKEISPDKKEYNYRLASYPDGMHIASQEVFLFANGSEIATNLSAKHVRMTKKDARVFLKYQYLTENSGTAKPPDRAWKYLDPHLRDRVVLEIRDEQIILKIDEEGIVQDLVTSKEVLNALTPDGIHEIASQIYLPALENGKPVPGELVLTLKDIVLD